MEQAVRIVMDGLMYLTNGLLMLGYFLVERLAHLTAFASALVIAGTFDRLIQSQAVFAPRRYEAGALVLSRREILNICKIS